MVEVALDLMGEGLGVDVWQMLASLRRGGHGIVAIAATRMSRELDARRREQWARMAEPDRPELPPQDHLTVFATYALEPLQCLGDSDAPPGTDPEAWSAMNPDEQQLALAELHRQAAEEQVEWEAKAQSGRGADEHWPRSRPPMGQRRIFRSSWAGRRAL